MGDSKITAKSVGRVLGPAVALTMLLAGTPEGLSFAAWGTACLLVWMAIWWATEAIPIPATSLLPLVVLPLIDAGSPKTVGADYMNHIVVLLLGGFVVAMGIERWDLHKRIALNVVARVGTAPKALILGFMIATALLSMWISNTATTLMMMPIALSAAAALGGDSHKLTAALLLCSLHRRGGDAHRYANQSHRHQLAAGRSRRHDRISAMDGVRHPGGRPAHPRGLVERYARSAETGGW